MAENIKKKPSDPVACVERIKEFSANDLNDLCDATDAAIEAGGGFGWLELPAREILERYWQGVMTMPARILFVARLDGVICGTCQIVKPPKNNEAQAHAVQLTTTFVAPWGRGHNLSRKLIQTAEQTAREEGFSVINLDVRETMQVAISLYESMGYVRIGMHPYYAKVDGEVVRGYHYYKVIEPKSMVREV